MQSLLSLTTTCFFPSRMWKLPKVRVLEQQLAAQSERHATEIKKLNDEAGSFFSMKVP